MIHVDLCTVSVPDVHEHNYTDHFIFIIMAILIERAPGIIHRNKTLGNIGQHFFFRKENGLINDCKVQKCSFYRSNTSCKVV